MMKIVSGLFDHMVLQRNGTNVSEACLEGLSTHNGPVLVTVRKKGKPFAAWRETKIGQAKNGRFTAGLKGLPTGGPYDIELLIGKDSLSVRDVLVGDVWLLGGQSNMQGYGHFPIKEKLPANSQVRALFMDDVWREAKDPLHNMWKCVDQVHIALSGGTHPLKHPSWRGVGPGPAFGQEMFRLSGQTPQGLIACAHGGTSMSQWDPELKKAGSQSLYGALLRRFHKIGGKVAGLIWYQGCSDVSDAEATPLYTRRMKQFIAALRRDCGAPRLPVAIVQISRVIRAGQEMAPRWNSIQDQQRRLSDLIPNLTCVPSIDVPPVDGIHVGGHGQNILGRRLARAMMALKKGRRFGFPPISIKQVTLGVVRDARTVFVEFAHLQGPLCSSGRPSGFQVVTSKSEDNVCDIVLDGKRAIIRTAMGVDASKDGVLEWESAVLHYGYGTNPYCNITDGEGRPVPVFGPIRIGLPKISIR